MIQSSSSLTNVEKKGTWVFFASSYHRRLFFPLLGQSDTLAILDGFESPRLGSTYPFFSTRECVGREALFRLCLRPGNKVLLPLQFGGALSHNYLTHLPHYMDVLHGKRASKIALYHEVPYFCEPNYIPQADLVLCRSQEEVSLFSSKTDTVFIGDTSLDSMIRKNVGDAVGIFVATDSHRIAESLDMLRDMLHSLGTAFKQRAINSKVIYVSDHPAGSGLTLLKPTLIDFARRHKRRLIFLDKSNSLANIADRIGVAYVHSSISTHLSLRRMGVESFYFTNPAGYPGRYESQLLSDSGEPAYSPHDTNRLTRCRHYDEWLFETFRLDGLCGERLKQAMRDL